MNVSAQSISPLDYEISSISKLEFFNEANQYLFSAYPFFTTAGMGESESGEYRNFFLRKSQTKTEVVLQVQCAQAITSLNAL